MGGERVIDQARHNCWMMPSDLLQVPHSYDFDSCIYPSLQFIRTSVATSKYIGINDQSMR